MVTATRVRVDEYLALPENGPPWLEYIDGQVVEKPVGNSTHSDVQARLAHQLGGYQMVAGGRVKTELRSYFEDPRDDRYMLPDVSFFRAGARMKLGDIGAPPTFAIEIRSPGQTVRTQRDRCRYYLAHGVEEAWFVNFEDATIQVFDGKRDGLIFDEGLVASSSLPGFAVSIEALFAGADDEWAPSAPLT